MRSFKISVLKFQRFEDQEIREFKFGESFISFVIYVNSYISLRAYLRSTIAVLHGTLHSRNDSKNSCSDWMHPHQWLRLFSVLRALYFYQRFSRGMHTAETCQRHVRNPLYPLVEVSPTRCVHASCSAPWFSSRKISPVSFTAVQPRLARCILSDNSFHPQFSSRCKVIAFMPLLACFV